MDRAGRADAVPGRPTAQGRCQTLKVALPPKAFAPAQAIRILVASDQAIARDGIRGLLERHADFRVVGHRHGRRDGPLHEGVQANLPAEVEDDRGGVASQKSEVRTSAAFFRVRIYFTNHSTLRYRVRQIRSRRVRQCIFCDNKPDSKEHLWAEWVLKRFSDNVGLYSTIDGVETYHADQRAVRVKCVCKPCNEGWMKALEDEILPVVSLMIQDVSLQLDGNQQAAVSRWSIKTAMVLEYLTHEPREIFYTDDERRKLKADHPGLPNNSAIWLARYTGDNNFFTRPADTWGGLENGVPGIHGYVMTLAFRAFVVQVFSVRAQPKYAGAIINANRDFTGSVVRIWPASGRPVSWPPSVAIDDRRLSLDGFHGRMATSAPPSTD